MLSYQSFKLMILAGVNALEGDLRGWEWAGGGTYVFFWKTFLVNRWFSNVQCSLTVLQHMY